MIELLKNPKVDWIGNKKYFIYITIFLLLLGAISVQVRGFNLGVDFTGGTLMTVRFKEAVTPDQIRSALSSGSVDTSKVTIQSVLGRSNEYQVRYPSSGNEFQDVRLITQALQQLGAPGDVQAGRVNINRVNSEGVEVELRLDDPLGINDRQFAGPHPYRQVGDQIVAFRDQQSKGYIQDISALAGLNLTAPNMEGFDQAKVKEVLTQRFYAGKIDLNLVSTKEIEDALYRINPLQTSDDTYTKAAKAIGQYRTDRDGVIASLGDIQVQDVSADLLAKMEPYFTTGNFTVVSADVVGPQVGEDLRNRAIYVTLAALGGMLIFIAFRFEWIYGVAAVIAVFHDVLVTLGFFSLVREEISLTVIAALLTLVGYSMNDTIVIFDRIRELLRLRRRDPLVRITNDAINETLSRTIITSGLTFLSVVAILLFGGEVLRGFALALTIGIVVGSYSTIGIASPIMLWWEYITNRKGKAGPPSGGTRARATERNLAKV
ncbi:MAG TPA: protein translocase subunit SecF [Blastocatellia bacterium]|nr:protein translocase subunit SecF [Blastocatellia bacterium]